MITMEDLVIKDMKIIPCVDSKYVQPSRLQFNQVRPTVLEQQRKLIPILLF